ncbi:MAG: hypothetical protein AAF697_00385 [Pseudomonadota bacterium]
MRSFISALLLATMLVPGWSSLQADPGTEAERVSRASSVDEGMGAVVISIRSALYLEDRLDVFFLREGGNIENDADVVRFGRKQGLLSLGNNTTSYKVRAYQLPPGTYRLVAHGVGCPKVPAVDERCLVDASFLTGTEEISRPSRGYTELAPRFEVRSGQVTYAGDFALTAQNTIEWSVIPADEIERTQRRFSRFPRAPDPEIPEEFALKYVLSPRSLNDDWNRRY